MPELPEVESARSVLERAALKRRIADVDDSDSYVCRPHPPGQIRAALLGRMFTAARRQGKSMWLEVSPLDSGGDGGVTDTPVLGIHLGMSGKIVISSADGDEVDGGDYWERGRRPGDYKFSRFAVTFDDGGAMMLVDPRRLGRVRLDPPVDLLGPDAATVTPKQFRELTAHGTIPVKARLLDQHKIAGIGNLLADDILWLAKINPARPVQLLTPADRDRLLRAVRTSISAAISGGGVHTLTIVPYRKEGGPCPRDGAPMNRGTVGGRTTYWCSREQSY